MGDNKQAAEVISLPKRIIRIVGSVVLYSFIVVSIFAVMLVLFGQKDPDGTVTVLGRQMRTVLTGSMEECEHTNVEGFDIGSIKKGAMVFIETVPEDPKEAAKWYEALEVGDVLTFRYLYTNQETITHRIIKKDKVEGGYKITLRGDNINSKDGALEQVIDTSIDPGIATNYVIGKVVGTSFALGWFISLIKEPIGMVFIIILPCVAIIVLEIVRIFGVVGEEKRRKLTEEHKEKDDRIAELEKMIAELAAAKANGEDGKE